MSKPSLLSGMQCRPRFACLSGLRLSTSKPLFCQSLVWKPMHRICSMTELHSRPRSKIAGAVKDESQVPPSLPFETKGAMVHWDIGCSTRFGIEMHCYRAIRPNVDNEWCCCYDLEWKISMGMHSISSELHLYFVSLSDGSWICSSLQL
jgi:hypothetical protein